MDYTGQFIRGARILAKTVDGMVERIVWEDCGEAVLVCSERQYDALKRGWSAPMPIGFAKTDIKLVGA